MLSSRLPGLPRRPAAQAAWLLTVPADRAPRAGLGAWAWLPALAATLIGGATAVLGPVALAATPEGDALGPRLQHALHVGPAPQAEPSLLPLDAPRGHRAPRPERAGRMVDRLLIGVDDISAEQRSQLHAIAREALRDLAEQHAASQGLHARQRALLAAPTVDAQAAEALRLQMLAQHDLRSRRMLQASLDASRVLSPAQRQQLAQRLAERQAAHRGHRGPVGPGDFAPSGHRVPPGAAPAPARRLL